MADDRFLLKDLFDTDTVGALAAAVAAVCSAFDRTAFAAAVFDDDWSDRELKERMRHVAAMLREHLPGDYREALGVLRAAVPRVEGAGFAAMVFSDFVEAYGTADFEASVPALAEFTTLVSAEFAVRPFLRDTPERMLEVMEVWASSPDWRLRRLASEGSRPRLPWGLRLKALVDDPAPIIPILEQLRHDPSEDVRRSVANNLNDIAKDHPDLVVDLLSRWMDGSPEVEGITQHALRTLLKQGHPGALGVLGFRTEPEVSVSELAVNPATVEIGGATRFRCVVASESSEPQALMIDYAVDYPRMNGAVSTKVFKGRVCDLAPGETIRFERKLSLAQMSTRTIHPGRHAVEIIVNGARLGRAVFDVVA